MTLFLVVAATTRPKGASAWVVGNTLSKRYCSSSASTLLTRAAALQFRCGGTAAATGVNNNNNNNNNKWLSAWTRSTRLPVWASAQVTSTTTAGSSNTRLFQSAATDAETSTTSSPTDATTSTTCTSSPSWDTKILADDPDFVKPDPDDRKYRWIRLANNLQVLLVSTTETTSKDHVDVEVEDADADEEEASGDIESHVEAAAVHVQAGHFDDTIPGVSYNNTVFCVFVCVHSWDWLLAHVFVAGTSCIFEKMSSNTVLFAFKIYSWHTFMNTCSFWGRKNTPKKMIMNPFLANMADLATLTPTWKIPIITFP